ncbi:MAG TPA: PilN domain-containing protein [Solirubrobacteraceae bacterium]|jgi:Tfp pilus assembly protein PilN
MKAVNLIPAEERRGGGSATGSGFASYVVLGVLALIVLVSAAYTIANRTIADRRHELADVQARAEASASQAAALENYTNFSGLRQKRSETVRSLAASRFDWSHALHEVARTIPSDAWLTSMRGSVAPSSNVDGGTSDPLRSSLPSPAIELIGCTTSQDKVAAVISSLRRVDGVERVSLSSSAKTDQQKGGNASAAGDSTGSDTDCRHGSSHYPQFSMTLFFKAPAATGATSSGQGTTP